MSGFEEGTWIELHGLKTSHLNGKQGEIVKIACDETNWRFIVKLLGEERSLSVKSPYIRRFQVDTSKLQESFSLIGEKNYGEFLIQIRQNLHHIETMVEIAQAANKALSIYFGNGYAHLVQAHLATAMNQPLVLLQRHYRRAIASRCFTNALHELKVTIEYSDVLEQIGALAEMNNLLTRSVQIFPNDIMVSFKHARCLRKLNRKHDSLRLYKVLFDDISRLDADSEYVCKKVECIGDYFDCAISIGIDYRVRYNNSKKSVELLRDVLSSKLFSGYVSAEKFLYARLHFAAAVVEAGNTLLARNIVHIALDDSFMNHDCYDYRNFAFYILGMAYLRDGENSDLKEEIFESYESASEFFGKASVSNPFDQASRIQKVEVDAELEVLRKRFFEPHHAKLHA